MGKPPESRHSFIAGLNVGYGVESGRQPVYAFSDFLGRAMDEQKKAGGRQCLYWAALSVSCLWFLLAMIASVYCLAALFHKAPRLNEARAIEVAIYLVVAIQPVAIGWCIIRAIRLRHVGPSSRIVARATAPLATTALLAVLVSGYVYDLNQIRARTMRQATTGSITYDCSEQSETLDFDPSNIGEITLRLTSLRHPRELSNWTVHWLGKPPIEAQSFDADTGSMGGSQGIEWRDADGRTMVAFLSFSDIYGEYGTTTIWTTVVRGEIATAQGKLDAGEFTRFTCGPDPKSYRE